MGYISDMRKFVGHAPIMAVAAMGILYNEEKGLLLEKRTDTGEWCTPGGAIELGETLEEALKREYPQAKDYQKKWLEEETKNQRFLVHIVPVIGNIDVTKSKLDAIQGRK